MCNCANKTNPEMRIMAEGVIRHCEKLQIYLVIVNVSRAFIQSIWHCLKKYRDCRYLFGVSLHSEKEESIVVIWKI